MINNNYYYFGIFVPICMTSGIPCSNRNRFSSPTRFWTRFLALPNSDSCPFSLIIIFLFFSSSGNNSCGYFPDKLQKKCRNCWKFCSKNQRTKKLICFTFWGSVIFTITLDMTSSSSAHFWLIQVLMPISLILSMSSWKDNQINNIFLIYQFWQPN